MEVLGQPLASALVVAARIRLSVLMTGGKRVAAVVAVPDDHCTKVKSPARAVVTAIGAWPGTLCQ